MAALSYMQRRPSGIYEFRRRLPSELAGRPAPAQIAVRLPDLVNPKTGCFKREFTVSLKTTDTAKAKRQDMAEALRFTDMADLAVRMLKGGPAASAADGGSDFPTPAEVEADTLAALLKADEEEREHGDLRRHLQTPQDRTQWPDLEPVSFGRMGMQEDHFEALGEGLELLEADYRKALARRQPDIVRAELHAYLKGRELPIVPTSPFYRDAGMAVLRAHAKAYALKLERHAGKDVPTPPASPQRGPKLSEAFTSWKTGSGARGAKTPAPKTVREAERSVRLFSQWHGDLRLGDITKEKARDFRNAIARVPGGLSKEERALPLRKLLERDLKGRLPAHAATVNKHLNLLSAVVSMAEGEGKLDALTNYANPFRGLSLGIDERGEDRVKVFSEADFAAIFGTKVYRDGARPAGGGGEAAFWLPLMAVLTGARQGELAQLRLGDLREDADTGVWIIDISAEGGRSIKTASSRRQVPLHPELVRLGLLGYRDALEKAGSKATDPLWPGIKSADKLNQSAAWSKWFNRYLREAAGIIDRDLVFHSFRHTFKRLCRDAGLSEETHDSLTGHAGAGGVGRSYGKGFGLKALEEAVGKVRVPRAVSGLKPWAKV